MTEERRKSLSKTILAGEEETSSTSFEDESNNNLADRIKEDENNRLEFIDINDRLYSMEKEYNLLTSLSPQSLEISEVEYKTGYKCIDNIDLWKGASLTQDNIFYYPITAEKLDLNTIVEGVDKCNIEPTIPDIYKNFTIKSGSTTISENRLILFLKWLIDGYINGIDTYTDFSIASGYSENTILQLGVLTGSIVDVNKKTRLMRDVNNHFFSYILDAHSTISGEGWNSDATFLNATPSSTITYPLEVIGNLTIGDPVILTYIDEVVAVYYAILQIEKTLVSKRKSKNSKDNTALSSLIVLLTDIKNFIALETKTGSDLNGLLSILLNRETFIGSRTTEIEAFFSKEFSKADSEGLYDQRSFIIKLRLKKKEGTLNNIYREIKSGEGSKVLNTSKQSNLDYYKKKLLVKKILQDANNSKTLFVNYFENIVSEIKIGDIVYIIDDDSSEELETIVSEISDDYVEQVNLLTSLPMKIKVKKIKFENRIPERFKKDNNLRLVKQLRS